MKSMYRKGAARGMGKAVVIKYAQNGAYVVVMDINNEVENMVEELKALRH